MAKKRKAKSTSMTRTFTDGDTTVKVTVKDKNNMTASIRRDSGDTIAFLYN